jgi:hypothetical protein
LTHSSGTIRTGALVDTLRGLGHLIHLVQDASVPQHTRNDPHGGVSLEKVLDWILRDESNTFDSYLIPVIRPNATWKTMPSNPLAPVAIARLIDTDRYTGQNPEVTIQDSIGVAEYSNANFVTEDRNWASPAKNALPFPSSSSVYEWPSEIAVPPLDRVWRLYYVKMFHGDSGYRVATVGYLGYYLVKYGLSPTRYGHHTALDETVYRDIAPRLLPRAVGYSAELLEYFFRGRMGVALTLAPDGSLLKGNVRITNELMDEDMQGTFALYYDAKAGDRRVMANWTLTLAPGQQSVALPVAVPSDAVPGSLRLVFTGRLGLEPGAVATAPASVTLVRSLQRVGMEATTPEDGVIDRMDVMATSDLTPSWVASGYVNAWDDIKRTRWDSAPPSGDPIDTMLRVDWDKAFPLLYRSSPMGGAETLLATPNMVMCDGYDELQYFHSEFWQYYSYTSFPMTPATVELVAFRPPEDVATLLSYTYVNRPVEERVLATFTGVEPGEPVELPAGDSVLLGLRLRTLPTDPGPLPLLPMPMGYPARTYMHGCGAAVKLEFRPATAPE